MAKPLLAALAQRKVTASVVDFDHYRIRGGMAVETDYIISVQPSGEVLPETFEAFKISKTYSAFRTFANQLKKVADHAARNAKDWDSLSPEVKHAIKFSESVAFLVDSQRTEYLGKVNFTYVKSLAKQRSQTINDALESVLQNFPSEEESKGEKCIEEIAGAIEAFFLTDHLDDDEDDASSPQGSPKRKNNVGDSSGSKGLLGALKTPSKKKQERGENLLADFSGLFGGKKKVQEPPPPPPENVRQSVMSPVIPISRKTRKGVEFRAQDEADLQGEGSSANLFLDDDRNQATLVPSYSAPVPVVQSHGSKITFILENNPYVFAAITAVSLAVLRSASYTSVTVDTDIALLIVFAFFCFGFHLPRPARVGVDTVRSAPMVTFKKQQRSSSALLRKSMLTSPKAQEDVSAALAELEEEEEEAPPLIKSPMDVFPPDAELGSKFNCWSEPEFVDFKVRGQKYLKDKKKVSSGAFLFPNRGVDLFLTDACPENVGRISGVMGGQLRELPTFIINFRLPWGVLLFYFEIAENFVPFLRKAYEPDYDESLPSLDSMTPGERTTCRFLLGDDQYKNERLKIVPVVVEGPWVVKSVVGGKPAIIGTKMPVTWVYQPREGDKAEYLELDLDIVASSAARGILSVVRSYTQGLTLDLGFVVQGNEEDELPEQMLTGTRMHGIDPLNAPPLPPMKDLYMGLQPTAEEPELVSA